MFKEIIGISTWCDYLTPCPNGKDCMVGDFDCSQCKHFVGIKNVEHNCSVNIMKDIFLNIMINNSDVNNFNYIR